MTKKSSSRWLTALALTALLSGCNTLNHTVGRGAQGSHEESKRVWYALWGLVPLDDDFDSQELAGSATDYDVESQWTFTDIVLNIFTSLLSFNSQTVTVKT